VTLEPKGPNYKVIPKTHTSSTTLLHSILTNFFFPVIKSYTLVFDKAFPYNIIFVFFVQCLVLCVCTVLCVLFVSLCWLIIRTFAVKAAR
jgi:hypothetical protein